MRGSRIHWETRYRNGTWQLHPVFLQHKKDISSQLPFPCTDGVVIVHPLPRTAPVWLVVQISGKTLLPKISYHEFLLSFSIRLVSITAMTTTLAMVKIPTITRNSMRSFTMAFPCSFLRMVPEKSLEEDLHCPSSWLLWVLISKSGLRAIRPCNSILLAHLWVSSSPHITGSCLIGLSFLRLTDLLILLLHPRVLYTFFHSRFVWNRLTFTNLVLHHVSLMIGQTPYVDWHICCWPYTGISQPCVATSIFCGIDVDDTSVWKSFQ